MNFLEGIQRTVQSELRLAGLFTDREAKLPEPHDLDAEGELCSAALGGYLPSDLNLLGSDFYSDLNAHVWVAACAALEIELEPSVRVVCSALEASGFRGPNLEQEVQNLKAHQPYVSEAGLRTRAALVQELARRRRLISRLEKIVKSLRSGASSHAALEAILEIWA